MTRTLLRLCFAIAFLLASTISLWRVESTEAQSHDIPPSIPLGLPADTWLHFVPRQNPQTAAKIELGRKLFFDKRLSADGTVACATCHQPERAFADDKPVAEGVAQRRGARNAPSLLNVIYNNGQFWDGRSDTLEEQAVLPLVNSLEMGDQTHADVLARLQALPDYVALFQQAFAKSAEISVIRLGQALAAFERTLLSGAAPLDRHLAGDKNALNEAELRGMAVFRGRGRCTRCHTMNEHRMLFSDYEYRNTGVAARHPEFEKLARLLLNAGDDERRALTQQLAQQPGGAELGRMLVSHHILDIGAFHTPSLRNVALTAPYFHDGSAATLADVVRFYNQGGQDNLNIDTELHPLGLSEEEQRDLVTFLGALTGTLPETKTPKRVAPASVARVY